MMTDKVKNFLDKCEFNLRDIIWLGGILAAIIVFMFGALIKMQVEFCTKAEAMQIETRINTRMNENFQVMRDDVAEIKKMVNFLYQKGR